MVKVKSITYEFTVEDVNVKVHLDEELTTKRIEISLEDLKLPMEPEKLKFWTECFLGLKDFLDNVKKAGTKIICIKTTMSGEQVEFAPEHVEKLAKVMPEIKKEIDDLPSKIIKIIQKVKP